MERVNSESNDKQGLSIAESCASSTIVKTTSNYNNIESKKAKEERQERYNARCKELEAEALAQMPYKVGDTVKWKVNGKTGIIEAICERDMGPWGRRKLYTVNFDKDTEFPTGVRSLGAKYLAEALEPVSE